MECIRFILVGSSNTLVLDASWLRTTGKAGGSLEGAWREPGGSLEGVWREPGGSLREQLTFCDTTTGFIFEMVSEKQLVQKFHTQI